MTPETPTDGPERSPRFRNPHRRRPLRTWVLPLLFVVALMVLLPRLVRLLEG